MTWIPGQDEAVARANASIERVAAWLLWSDESIRTLERARDEARAVLEIANGTADVPESAASLWGRMGGSPLATAPTPPAAS